MSVIVQSESMSSRSEVLEIVAAEARKRSTEEYRRSACEDVKCDWKILCVISIVI
jgi:hypothetical protein